MPSRNGLCSAEDRSEGEAVATESPSISKLKRFCESPNGPCIADLCIHQHEGTRKRSIERIEQGHLFTADINSKCQRSSGGDDPGSVASVSKHLQPIPLKHNEEDLSTLTRLVAMYVPDAG